MYVLRPPRSDDFEPLFAIQAAAYRRWVEEVGWRWDPAEARRRLATKIAGQLEVIEVNSRLVGALAVRWDDDPVFLGSVELAPAHQRRGLGTRVVHDVLVRARSLGREVALQVLRPNPAAELYRRMGFVAVGESDTHVQMRWRGDDAATEALARAMAPWLDESRRDAWAQRLFAPPVDEHVAFVRFVAARHGLSEDLGAHALDERAREILRIVDAREVEGGERELVLSCGGGLLDLVTHAERVAAVRRECESLRPGGLFVIDAPNMPWMLRFEPDPQPRTIVHHAAMLSCIPERTLDFHDAVAIERDTYVAEIDEVAVAQWTCTQRRALIGQPELRLVLEQAGLADIETYPELSATGPGRTRGRWLLMLARAPG